MRIRFGLFAGCRFPLRIAAFGLLIALLTGAVTTAAAKEFESGQTPQESTKKILKKAKKLLRKGLYSDSEALIKKALVSDPANETVKTDLAYVFLKQKREGEAFALAFDVAKNNPQNGAAYAIVGTIYLLTGDFAAARMLLVNSINLQRKEALAWSSLGLLEFYENNLSASILHLEEAVFLDSREPDFIFALAQVSARGERYRKSAAAYEQFLRIAPEADAERKDRIKGLISFLRYLGKRNNIYRLSGENATTVGMEIVNNRPIIQIRLKKDGPLLDFVLDTGSGMMVVSEETAKLNDIRPVAKGGLARALGGDGKFPIVYGFLNSVRIGDVRIRNVPTYIRKFPEGGTRVDGYIGVSILAQYIATIDYGESTFSLVKKDAFEETAPHPDALTIPLRLTSSGFLSGIVQFKGFESDYHFILDTGASVSVVSNALAAEDAVSEHKTEELMRVVGAAGITENVPMYWLKGLKFGGIAAPDLRAVALDLDLINETAGFEHAGIIGGNFLRDYRLTFDFKGSKVIFVPN